MADENGRRKKQADNNNLQSVSLVNALNSATRSEYPLSNLINEHMVYDHASNGFENNNMANPAEENQNIEDEAIIDEDDNFPMG
ncbi:hypothetical protein RH915_03670 [Serpentinicella sp. ANB-PHB4]|uniref:hypothetical protein n=1 Tax=Serpentinicella sp. ANB-PHB4 TaxID=3074076 RepID=UPI002862FBF2|nr:hypothetical protein [Serpentinicella sp. ANB-PHB4]MDR5658582.1 hypothetical protein [Serpentinicella sp. ANB-PHB4]